MRASFSTNERIHNSALAGAQIYYEDKLEVIQYVKLEENTGQIIFHCLSGNVFSGRQNEQFDFEVNQFYELKKVNKRRLRGKRR